MKTIDMMNMAAELVEFGRKNGASQMEVSLRRGTEFSVDVREGEIEKLTEAGSQGLYLRLFVDTKMARANSSDLTPETLQKLVKNAIGRARLASADPLAGLPEKEPLAADAAVLKIYDPAIVEMAPETKIALARTTEAVARADKRVNKSFGSSFQTYVGEVFLANSSGFQGTYKRTSCSCGVNLQAGEGTNLFDEGFYDTSTSLAKLEAPEVIAKKAIHRVTRLIGARKVSTQNVPVVLEPEMTGSLLDFFGTCVDGENVYLNQSFLAGKLGEKIAKEGITIVDDGQLPGGPGTRPFDTEGVPARKTVLVENGSLRNYLLDTYAARKLKLKSTGNGAGSTNLYLAAGGSTPQEIIRSVDKGLLLTGTIGFGLVPTTGDISRGAFGLWIEKGEIAYPVAEITISGNLGQILRQIEMVGNDLAFKDATTGPTIKIAEMTVGGT
jgi:PmbA protein